MHLLMMAEAGAPILTGLFLEMNAGALAPMGASWLLPREMRPSLSENLMS
jgi:hypothetical protein